MKFGTDVQMLYSYLYSASMSDDFRGDVHVMEFFVRRTVPV